ncbi:membrane protein [Pandoraea terrigena]|uniref:Membrane protein n=1 Tax=Pandoraea terrigena TaxID=2508292 RepID=A0A5E4U349_9BURK|nr:membrane protein [Pandoraea terrigena]
MEPRLRLFFYLPFAHSKDLGDQCRSVDLHRTLGHPWVDHALGHKAIIERFGRFPHRNPLQGRRTTEAEQAFLDQGGFAG